MATVQMVQIFQHKWHIRITKNQVVLKDDIFISNLDEAEKYVRAYISSWTGWTYEMLLLPPKPEKK